MWTFPIITSGAITELVGPPSSGRTSVFTACLRDVTARGALAAFVDTDHVFDPIGAVRGGVELSRVLWVRCGHRLDRALRAVDLLVRCPGFALVGLDMGDITPRLALAMAYRLKLAVRRTGTALVVLSRHRVVASGAALALAASRRDVAWAGPRPTPSRLDAVDTALEVLRARAVAPEVRPGAVHLVRLRA
jgi:hypothetical protein